MRAYMGFDDNVGSSEGACLVFANNAKEARKLAFNIVCSWYSTEWIDCRVKWLKNSDHLFESEGNQELLAKNIAHAIESPDVCKNCEIWGYEKNEDGTCRDCG